MLFLVLFVLITSCVTEQKEEDALQPEYLPVLDSFGQLSASTIQQPDSDEAVFDWFVPAFREFTPNSSGASVGDTVDIALGDMTVPFTISDDNGVYVYSAESADNYRIELRFSPADRTFTYYQILNLEHATNGNQMVRSEIPSTTVADDGTFRAVGKTAAYWLGTSGDQPGWFLADQVELYNGTMTDSALDGDQSGSGLGIAFFRTHNGSFDSAKTVGLDGSAANELAAILDDAAGYAASGNTITMGMVAYDHGSGIQMETDANGAINGPSQWAVDFEEDYPDVDYQSADDIPFSYFTDYIPWETDLYYDD